MDLRWVRNVYDQCALMLACSILYWLVMVGLYYLGIIVMARPAVNVPELGAVAGCVP